MVTTATGTALPSFVIFSVAPRGCDSSISRKVNREKQTPYTGTEPSPGSVKPVTL